MNHKKTTVCSSGDNCWSFYQRGNQIDHWSRGCECVLCFEGKRQVQLGEMESNEALVSDDGAFDEMQEQQEEGQHQQSIMHSTTAAVLDEASLQQLMDSGTVGEDSIIAIVHNEHGEPQTVCGSC